MAEATTGALTDQLEGLFRLGTCAGMSDGELLERFRRSRDEGGERAFEALVTRHGPMVLGICRHFLEDPSDVHDAFQAVFLVLARRAGAIRKSESVGSWLYGVTVRIAARSRTTAIRRRLRERRERKAAEAVARSEVHPDATIEREDGAAVVHEELVRLPESFRAPIVLCYFEGLTHDEAAARLSCPVGTVRSRLARARDRLRTRLARRGVAAPATIGPMADWLIAGGPPSGAAMPLPFHVPSLSQVAAGPSTAAAMTLAEGVLRTMMLRKLTIAAGLIASLGIGTGTGALLIGRVGAQDSPARPAPAATKQVGEPAAGPEAPEPTEAERLLERAAAAARQRFETQKATYYEGRITLDRFIAASESLRRVEFLAARSDDERQAIRRRHVDRLKEIADREQAELLVGRSTAADVAEIVQAFSLALFELKAAEQFELKVAEQKEIDLVGLLRRVADLEQKVNLLQEQVRRARSGR